MRKGLLRHCDSDGMETLDNWRSVNGGRCLNGCNFRQEEAVERNGATGLAESVIYSGGAMSVADSKGRFVLPLDMRKALRQSSDEDTRLCLSIHPTLNCAIGFGLSHKRWMEDDISMRERNALDKGLDFDADAERAAIFSDIDELNFDDGGRFFLPADLKRMMGIDDMVVFVGVGKYIRLWSPERLLASDSCTPRVRAKVEEFLADPKVGGKK